MHYINPDECIDCGACEPACPVSAIATEKRVSKEEPEFIKVNRDWYRDKNRARAMVNAMSPAEQRQRTASRR